VSCYLAVCTDPLIHASTRNPFAAQALGIHGFKFPLLMTATHMAFGFIALAPLMLRDDFMRLHRPTLEKQWKGIMCIGLFMVSLDHKCNVYRADTAC
jgi:hypothetical protein